MKTKPVTFAGQVSVPGVTAEQVPAGTGQAALPLPVPLLANGRPAVPHCELCLRPAEGGVLCCNGNGGVPGSPPFGDWPEGVRLLQKAWRLAHPAPDPDQKRRERRA